MPKKVGVGSFERPEWLRNGVAVLDPQGRVAHIEGYQVGPDNQMSGTVMIRYVETGLQGKVGVDVFLATWNPQPPAKLTAYDMLLAGESPRDGLAARERVRSTFAEEDGPPELTPELAKKLADEGVALREEIRRRFAKMRADD